MPWLIGKTLAFQYTLSHSIFVYNKWCDCISALPDIESDEEEEDDAAVAATSTHQTQHDPAGQLPNGEQGLFSHPAVGLLHRW